MTPLVVVADGVAWAWSAVEITGGYDLSRADPARAVQPSGPQGPPDERLRDPDPRHA